MKNNETTDSREELGERRIGLLGGSFNPAHAGHLHVSRQALRLLELNEVWWLVSPQNPLKPEKGMAPLRDRMDGAWQMAHDEPEISVTDIEAELGTIYTIDTLEALHQRHPRAKFVLLAGADILEEIPRWRRWEQVLGLAARRFAQFRIKEEDAPTLASRTPPAWVFLHIEEHPASATAIRAARETD
jgi:nicotinate-nucleotide adenylyltransferase